MKWPIIKEKNKIHKILFIVRAVCGCINYNKFIHFDKQILKQKNSCYFIVSTYHISNEIVKLIN